MARFRSVAGIVGALGLLGWRDVQSFRSIGGQNFFLFLAFIALQPESAAFFAVILALVLLFPMSTDPMGKLPIERRTLWPLKSWEWICIRAGASLMNPVLWVALLLLWRAGWQTSAVLVLFTFFVQVAKLFFARTRGSLSMAWLHAVPAPPGLTGALMRLHWREMLQTLDPYIAVILVLCTWIFQLTGKPLDATAPRILSMITVLVLSTGGQTLLGMDGAGAQRYRQLPIRGWQILLAKDLAFLSLVGLLTLSLQPGIGLVCGLAVLAIGHHRSVHQPVSQVRWRFTEGAIVPDGLVQVIALFAIGNAVAENGLVYTSLALLVWAGSLLLYGRQWDRLGWAS